MHIDRTNYEAYLIDYLEGTLEERDKQVVRAFLLKHPEIAEELEGMEAAVLEPENSTSLNTSALQRTFSDVPQITATNYEEFCVAWHEGDLDAQGKNKLEAYLADHPQAANTFRLYQEMHFEADTRVLYPNKKNLLQPVVVPLYTRYRWAIGAAAAAIIGFVLFITYPDRPVIDDIPKIAKRDHEARQVIPEPEVQTASVRKRKTIVSVNPEDSRNNNVSTEPPQRETVKLASLETIPATLETEYKTKKPTPLILSAPVSSPLSGTKPPATALQRVVRLTQLARRNTSRDDLLWEAMNAGVRGYNRLTENQLALNTARNPEGRVTEFALHAGKLEVIRSMTRNDIN